MKLLSFKNNEDETRAGLLINNGVVDLHLASNGQLPADLLKVIQNHTQYIEILEELENARLNYTIDEVEVLAPLPNPPSLRDFMAFEEHVANARKNSGGVVPDVWYDIPVFYFSNHQAIIGPNAVVHRPQKTQALDFELEIACIIGKQGIDIPVEKAEEYIFGYTILNDFSARDLQFKEMKVGLGPAKGKDFATAIGPYIVTKDELEPYRSGKAYNRKMTASINDKIFTVGNWDEIYFSFAEMIARASESVTLYPGDIIGSGTVGGGCIVELPKEKQVYLQAKDKIELSVEGLGVLTNYIK